MSISKKGAVCKNKNLLSNGGDDKDGAEVVGKENTSMPKPKKKEKAKLVSQANVGSKIIPFTLEFDTEEVPERGSDAMFDAIFKSAKTGGRITKEDLIEIERLRKNFWKPSTNSKTPKSRGKFKKLPIVPNLNEPKSAKNIENLARDQETLDLLAEADRLIYAIDNPNSEPPLSSNHTSSGCSRKRSGISTDLGESSSKKTATATNYEVFILSDSEDDDKSATDIEDDGFGNMILFDISLRGVTYSIRTHENKKILEVREMLAKKSGIETEFITMFLGDDVQLEDTQTVKESGLTEFCNVDAYSKEKTDKELYLADSKKILRFKLQTADRRGRQTIHIYTKKTSPMRNVRDLYAKELNMDATTLKLMFDGDHINLDSIPEACDLEGEECIDVVIQ